MNAWMKHRTMNAGLERFRKSCIRFGQPDEGVGSPWEPAILRNGAGTPSSRSSFPIRENRYDISGNALMIRLAS